MHRPAGAPPYVPLLGPYPASIQALSNCLEGVDLQVRTAVDLVQVQPAVALIGRRPFHSVTAMTFEDSILQSFVPDPDNDRTARSSKHKHAASAGADLDVLLHALEGVVLFADVLDRTVRSIHALRDINDGSMLPR